jgi:NADPH2:quinone reductase
MSQVITARAIGGPEVLALGQRERPKPADGQVLVRTVAAGVNYIDIYFRTGLYPQSPPFVPGLEGAGVIEALGDRVSGLRVGDRVAWASVPGSYAAHVCAPADRVVAVPDAVDTDVAAAVMLQGMTAQYLTHATRETQPGDIAVVHAAAGGVGLLLCQLLARAGAVVIGICSTEEKRALAAAAGATHVLGYSDPPWESAVRALSDGRGADVVYDSVGRDTFEASLRALRPRGLLALYGQSSGPVPTFDPAVLNARGSLFLTRPSLAHYTRDRAELCLRAGAVFDAIRAGELEVRIGARFALADAAHAHRALNSRATTGKLLLVP